jgi:26S proteasome regulatory subunit N1
MAQDSDVPTSADKGKGKAVDEPKQDKAQANGKKDDEKIIDCMRLPSLPCAVRAG